MLVEFGCCLNLQLGRRFILTAPRLPRLRHERTSAERSRTRPRSESAHYALGRRRLEPDRGKHARRVARGATVINSAAEPADHSRGNGRDQKSRGSARYTAENPHPKRAAQSARVGRDRGAVPQPPTTGWSTTGEDGVLPRPEHGRLRRREARQSPRRAAQAAARTPTQSSASIPAAAGHEVLEIGVVACSRAWPSIGQWIGSAPVLVLIGRQHPPEPVSFSQTPEPAGATQSTFATF